MRSLSCDSFKHSELVCFTNSIGCPCPLMDSEVGLNAAVCSLQSRVSALEASGTLPRGDFEERLSALENARQIPRALLDEYRTYFDSSLWSLFQRASKDAKTECDTIREDFHKALLELREDTLEALTQVHERVDLLRQDLRSLYTAYIRVLERRVSALEGQVENTDTISFLDTLD